MSRKSNSSSSGGSEIDAEVFGPLTTIAEHSLRALASRVARDVGISTDSSFDNTALVRRISGSYNIVHIMEVETTKLVIRVPAFGWGAGMSKAAADALKSQVATMRLIRKKTKVPVPEVYSFDATDANEINAPFICLEFIPGQTVSDIWLDSRDETFRNQLRLKILTSLAKTMA
ncbi:altered inheritance of mitochondria protein 9, mitochondrial [Fusarium flagelliforme]|uniref:Altered inheritance of mitochondria protein 9, mitochondrial n=1 Tax=Fusarium flagelliforme TaxID=2675880 RepID=A0A395MII2_9HYPO|nr:altered inheritance of mitochondria protein 9, mitochondrial [Fusarium flagelliforme]